MFILNVYFRINKACNENKVHLKPLNGAYLRSWLCDSTVIQCKCNFTQYYKKIKKCNNILLFNHSNIKIKIIMLDYQNCLNPYLWIRRLTHNGKCYLIALPPNLYNRNVLQNTYGNKVLEKTMTVDSVQRVQSQCNVTADI